MYQFFLKKGKICHKMLEDLKKLLLYAVLPIILLTLLSMFQSRNGSSQTKTYINENFGLTLQIPQSYPEISIAIDDSTGFVGAYNFPNENKSVAIKIEKITPTYATLTDYKDSIITELSKQTPEATLATESDTKFGNLDGCTFQINQVFERKKIIKLAYIAYGKELSYTIIFTVDPAIYVDNSRDFEHIISTALLSK